MDTKENSSNNKARNILAFILFVFKTEKYADFQANASDIFFE